MSSEFDIVIVGGGIVGATLGCALARERLRVAVIETREPKPPAGNEVDLRVFALSLASRRVFENLGVWEAMVAARVSPYREMHVWDAGSDGVIHFSAADAASDALGYIVENGVILAALWSQLRALPDVQLLCPAKLEDIHVGERAAEVRLESGQVVRGSLVVGADGAWSRVRDLAGIHSERHDYDQMGVVCVVHTERPHQETAWQRFLPGGPLAFLPLSDGACSIVWSVPSDKADHLLALSDEQFRRELAEAFDHRLGAVTDSGERAAFPLHLARARQYTRDRIALAGDAAHVVHPLAGQGVNLGLLDVAVLCEEIQRGCENAREAGSRVVLRRYERRRKGDNLLTAGVMHALRALFGASMPPVARVRGWGLNLTDRLPPVKRLFMQHALGERPELPALARSREAG